MTRLIGFVASALVGLLMTACGGLQPEDPSLALRQGGAATASLKTVTATLKFTKGTVSFQGFALVGAKASVRLPSDSDTTYTVRQQDLQIGLEVVISNGHVYLHLPFSPFSEVTGTAAADIPDVAKLFDPKTGLPAVIPAGRNVKYIAVDKVDDVDSHKVEATYSADQVRSMLPQLNSSGDVDAIIWVGGSDHLIRKAILSGPFGDNGTASSVEVDMSRFNAAVSIASPA
ncbi:MAG TPA: LppX_LprAFG lipoprotein [Candidatus Dormibacteraeota bacterium]|nr:LppX_LprAFG lipoprotein [Candidatus Dormibacteraeota bacterium]